MDYYSKWIEANEVAKMADEIKIKLKSIFSGFGVPNTVIYDNVPFNSYCYKKVLNYWILTKYLSVLTFPKVMKWLKEQ